MKSGAGRVTDRLETVGTSVLTVFLRLPFSWRGTGAVIVGILLARWTWILFAPHTLSVLPAKVDESGTASAALFGQAEASAVATKADAILGDVHLVGVFSGKHGFAILKLDEKNQRGVALGEDIVSGTKLVEVDTDHVVLEHNGIRQLLALENRVSGNKGKVTPEHPLSVSGVENAVAGWNQANQELKKTGSSNVRK